MISGILPIGWPTASECLGRRGADRRLRSLRHQEPRRADGPQPEHGSKCGNPRLDPPPTFRSGKPLRAAVNAGGES